MRALPDGDYKYIVHARDHFSRYSWASPMKSKEAWPGTIIINGRPRHPQSQGLVEKGNDILQTKLSSWLEDNETNDWSLGLPTVICK